MYLIMLQHLGQLPCAAMRQDGDGQSLLESPSYFSWRPTKSSQELSEASPALVPAPEAVLFGPVTGDFLVPPVFMTSTVINQPI